MTMRSDVYIRFPQPKVVQIGLPPATTAPEVLLAILCAYSMYALPI